MKTLVTMLLVVGLMVGSAQAFESDLNVISPEQYQSVYINAAWDYLDYISPEQYQSAYVGKYSSYPTPLGRDADFELHPMANCQELELGAMLQCISPEQYQTVYIDAMWNYLDYISPEQYQTAYILLGK